MKHDHAKSLVKANLVSLALLQVVIDDASVGAGSSDGGEEGGAKAENGSSPA